MQFVVSIKCSPWPTSTTYGCTTSGGDWMYLTLSESDTTSCEDMCIAQGQAGCCYFDEDVGCYLKPGADVSQEDGDKALAVTCIPNGK